MASADVDVPLLYDAYSWLVPRQLEDFGLCRHEELAAALAADGDDPFAAVFARPARTAAPARRPPRLAVRVAQWLRPRTRHPFRPPSPAETVAAPEPSGLIASGCCRRATSTG